MSFWDSVVKFAQTARRALPPCLVCGAPGAQVCSVCGQVACHRHAYTNFGVVRSVCSTCMAEAFPFVAEDLRRGGMPDDWPYQEAPWEILGVDQLADEDEIRRAQREVSRLYHPDSEEGDQDRQVAVNKAAEEMLRMRQAA